MVGMWRQRYLEHWLAGLHDDMRPGLQRSVSDEEVADLISKTLQTKPHHPLDRPFDGRADANQLA